MDKRFLRKKMKYKRDSINKDDKAIKDKIIKEKLKETKFYKNSTNIFIYIGFGSEIDTKEYIKEFLSEGKNVFVPRIKDNIMEAVKIDSISDLVKNKYGIPEPSYNLYKTSDGSKNIDLIIVPGLAFDITGGRLGYGGGYYDRYLEDKFKNIPKIALAYDFQVINNVPTDKHDIRVDYIITEKREIDLIKNKSE